jgi:mono/diheme cytochrome c family protein
MAISSLKKTGAKRRTTVAGCLLLVAGLVSGCRQDMHDAPRYDPYEKSDIFPNHSSAQPLVAGTVPRGGGAESNGGQGSASLSEDDLLNTGKINNELASVFPFAITRADLDRGEERFNIYCSPCHGLTGEGNGMVVQRGYRQAANYHIDRLRAMPVGYFIDVMANGFGAMPDYKMQLNAMDRWRVAAYIRALQLSHAATEGDVPAAELEKLKSGAPAPAAAHGSNK